MSQYEVQPAPSEPITSVAYAPSPSTKLLVSSWDRHLYLYDTPSANESRLVQKFEQEAPILATCFGSDDTLLYSGGLDWDVRQTDPETGAQTVLSTHEAPVNNLVYDPHRKLLISSSWDNTLHLHDLTTAGSNASTVRLPEKPLALAVSPSKLVVAMGKRVQHIYDLASLSLLNSQSAGAEITIEPFQQRDSSLKFMTRSLACMPNDEGFAVSSIEGRVAVEWFDAAAEVQAKKYAFKCHRQDQKIDGVDTDVIFPVHAVVFHPTHGTFVTGGGDGVMSIWDALAKRRIKAYRPEGAAIAAMAFSGDGKRLACAISPQFETATEKLSEGPIKVLIKELDDREVRGKAGS